MTEPELSELIRCIVTEVLASQPTAVPKTAPSAPNGLVLFSGALLGFEAALDSLVRLRGQVNLDWTQTPAAERVLDQKKIAAVGMTPAAQSLVQAHDLLIMPTLTANLAAKIAHGIGDCLASNVAAEFIMSAKPVIVATNGVCPDGADKRGWFPNMPAGYAEMLRGNLARLRSFGVWLADAGSLDTRVVKALRSGTSGADRQQCKQKVITEEVIKQLTPGSTIELMAGAIVTDLAREAAASAQITLTARS